MSLTLPSYHKNFITAVRLLMAEREDLSTTQQVADWLEIKYMALYKVMDGTNRPTVDLCVRLCEKGGFSANWLFLNKGDRDLKTQASLNKIMRLLQQQKV